MGTSRVNVGHGVIVKHGRLPENYNKRKALDLRKSSTIRAGQSKRVEQLDDTFSDTPYESDDIHQKKRKMMPMRLECDCESNNCRVKIEGENDL
jgi:hypothetical protein